MRVPPRFVLWEACYGKRCRGGVDSARSPRPFAASLTHRLANRHDRTHLVHCFDLTPQEATPLLALVASRAIGGAVVDNMAVLKSILKER